MPTTAECSTRLTCWLKCSSGSSDIPIRRSGLTVFQKQLIDSQLAAAMKRKQAGKPQPLFGIPFAIKDNIDFAGRPTTAACPAFAYVAAESAVVVRKLCDAGAIAIGKTNLDQFATGLVGTRFRLTGRASIRSIPNIPAADRVPALAVCLVAAGLVSFALAQQRLTGSRRTVGQEGVPAAFNNIVGLKPTRGLISNRGLVPACRSIDCVSILSLSCDDWWTIMQVIEAFDPSDPCSHGRSELPPPSRSIPMTRFHFRRAAKWRPQVFSEICRRKRSIANPSSAPQN